MSVPQTAAGRATEIDVPRHPDGSISWTPAPTQVLTIRGELTPEDFDAIRAYVAQVRAEARAAALDGLGDIVAALSWAVGQMPSTGGRYTVAADQRLRDALSLLEQYYALREGDGGMRRDEG